MRAIVIACAVAFAGALAQAKPVLKYTDPEDGQTAVLHDVPCKMQEFSDGFHAELVDGAGNVAFTGCWKMRGRRVLMVWTDGDVGQLGIEDFVAVSEGPASRLAPVRHIRSAKEA